MAADQWLLDHFQPGDPPIFRLYAWNSPTLSLGRNEKIDDRINLEFCRNKGIQAIRRITGGKAVLHGSDLTYSVVGDVNDPRFGGGVLETYRYLAHGFYQFFCKLGLHAHIMESSISSDQEPHLCFSEPSASEILVEGRKLIGNAQRVQGSASRGRVFLQHGSIPLADPVSLMQYIFTHARESGLRQKMHSLQSLGVYPAQNEAELRALLRDTLADIYEACWQHRAWTLEEEQGIKETLPFFGNLAPGSAAIELSMETEIRVQSVNVLEKA